MVLCAIFSMYIFEKGYKYGEHVAKQDKEIIK